jgi:two-component system sensor histidine kinase KdpD
LVDQVLTNLVENAVVHCPQGSLVAISTVQVGTRVEVTVADDGPGVGEAERERIFDRFYQANAKSGAQVADRGMRMRSEGPEAMTATRPGTGMGLAICRGVVAAHGGTLRVEPSACGGAAFVFSLAVAAIGAHPSCEDEIAAAG